MKKRIKKRNTEKKNQRGYTLLYTVCIMTFVVMLVAAAVSMLQSTLNISKTMQSTFDEDTAFYQIEEYLAAGRFATADAYANEHGFYVLQENYTDEDSGANVYEATVYYGSSVKLFIQKRNGIVFKYLYGENGE